ncbi:MAG: uracil-DNA glycosylase family protein [bacterium]
MVNASELAYELDKYIRAQKGEEPPDLPASSAETGTTTTSNSPNSTAEVSSNSEPLEDQSEQQVADSPQQQLDNLEQEAQGCTKCKLSENRSQVVFGEGKATAKVMVIGEGPGAKEDQQGLPFVGPAGKLLRGLFPKLGLDEDDIYITNTVKCRPPGNRNPEQEELDACRSYLDEQVDLIDPEVVLTLGNFALRYCLGQDRSIMASRGEVYDWNGYTLIPTVHPAYVLRNSNESDKLFDDLTLVKKQLVEQSSRKS